ncbi:hypothetical protein HPT27_03240 [Permianibacter sp. IMCC34836]|uniref:hypothetical protein n=1 Tax=Permianibacter fluminis TaxID=2738515 RepID=UPI001556FC87|nr:hypothetical protein [Permianibacter fluminis]NQD36023.1 hypothetical protein [Permianibacter fluminis]
MLNSSGFSSSCKRAWQCGQNDPWLISTVLIFGAAGKQAAECKDERKNNPQGLVKFVSLDKLLPDRILQNWLVLGRKKENLCKSVDKYYRFKKKLLLSTETSHLYRSVLPVYHSITKQIN